MKKLVLIDGHHFMFRAFYAFYQMLDEDNPKNAIFGFASMLMTVLQKQKPDYLAFAFDKGKSFRHDEKEDYKGTRSACPEALKVQMPKIYDMVRLMGINQYYTEGYEADDVLGSIAHTVTQEHEDIEVTIVSGDKDLLQLVNEKISIAAPQKGGVLKIYDAAMVEADLGVHPHQVPDYKGIAGDSADNIKGVPGVGPKTAVNLLKEYENLEGIYANLENLKGAVKKKMEENKEEAFHSKYIATIVKTAPVDFHIEHLNFKGLSNDIVAFFHEYRFPSLQQRVQFFLEAGADAELNDMLDDVFGSDPAAQKKEPPKNEQLSLF